MLDVDRIVDGSFGELWQDGIWQEHINNVTAEVEISKSDIRISGSRWVHKKVTGLSGSGTISGFKVTSAMLQQSAWTAGLKGKPTKTEFISKLADPEAYGYERVKLKNVKFDKVTLANWTAGQEITEETPFTFEMWELLDPIEAN